jgi:hypothetical protein
MVERRRRKVPECNIGIKGRSARCHLHLRKEKRSGRMFKKTVELDIETPIVEFSTGVRKMSD